MARLASFHTRTTSLIGRSSPFSPFFIRLTTVAISAMFNTNPPSPVTSKIWVLQSLQLQPQYGPSSLSSSHSTALSLYLLLSRLLFSSLLLVCLLSSYFSRFAINCICASNAEGGREANSYWRQAV
jgi:hypothetical protein